MDKGNSYNFLKQKLDKREEDFLLRKLTIYPDNYIDFFSNDYLGFARNKVLYQSANQILEQYELRNGSTGSRLISGNYLLYKQAEDIIAKAHNVDAALIYNSGYDANVGFWSCVPQRGDFILYDELVHASIRDGIRLSFATSFSFHHNDLQDLKDKLSKTKGRVFVALESVYSMDGDCVSDEIVEFCFNQDLHLVIDEAHSFGVLGLNFIHSIHCFSPFARLVTYGKAMGGHGAAILGPQILKEYLINFSRSFIYTTALPPHSVALIVAGYNQQLSETNAKQNLQQNITYFNKRVTEKNISDLFVTINQTPIKALLVGDKLKTNNVESALLKKGILVKGVYSPTVPKGKERIRICMHAYNTKNEIDLLVDTIVKLL